MGKIIFRIPEENYLKLKELTGKAKFDECRFEYSPDRQSYFGSPDLDRLEMEEFSKLVDFSFFANRYFHPIHFKIHPRMVGEDVIYENSSLMWDNRERGLSSENKTKKFEDLAANHFFDYRWNPKEIKWSKNSDSHLDDLCVRFRPEFEKLFGDTGLGFELIVPFNLAFEWFSFHELNSIGRRKRYKTVTDTFDFDKPELAKRIKNKFKKEMKAVKEALAQDFIDYINISGDIETADPVNGTEDEFLRFIFRFMPSEDGSYTMNWKLDFYKFKLLADILVLPEK